MWQRFTERARSAVFFAQQEANRLGENNVNTEHLLLGIIQDESTVAVRILNRMGVAVELIRSKIEPQSPVEPARPGYDMQLTPLAKRVIDLAYDEARQISNNYIGTEHLLLGLIREGEGRAGRVLAELGVDLNQTRDEVKALQDNDSGAVQPENVPQQATPQNLGDYLIKKGYVSAHVLEGAKKIQQATQGDLAKILIEIGVNLTYVYEAIAQERGMPFIDVTVYQPDQGAIDTIPVELAQRRNVLPVKREGNTLYIAMSDINDLTVTDELRLVSKCTVRGLLAAPMYITEAILRHYPDAVQPPTVSDEEGQEGEEAAEPLREPPTPSDAQQQLGALIQADTAKWRGRSLVTLFDVSSKQVLAALECAASFKERKQQDRFVYFSHPKTLLSCLRNPRYAPASVLKQG